MRILNTLQLLLVSILTLGMTLGAFAQDKADENRKAKIKIVKDVDGKKTVLDRTIELQNGESLEDALKRTGLDKEMEAISGNGKEVDIDVDIDMSREGDTNTRTTKKVIVIEEDGKIDEMELKEGSTFNFNTEEGGNVEIIEKNGKQIIRIQQEDGENKVIEIMGDEVKINGESENVMIFKSGVACCKKEEAAKCCPRGMKKMHGNRNKAALGVMLTEEVRNEDGVETRSGVVVKEVFKESAAEEAGLQEGDVIKSVDGKEVISHKEVLRALSQFEAGDKVKIGYERNGKKSTTKATLKANPDLIRHNNNGYEKCIIKKRMGGEGADVDIEEIMENIEIEGDKDVRVIIKKRMDGADVDIEKIIEEIEVEIEGDEKARRVMIFQDENGQITKKEMNLNVWIKDVEEVDVDKIENASLKKAASENSLTVESLQFYPNPSDGRFDLSFNLPAKGETTVRVVDMAGKEVFQDKVGNFSGTYEKQIDISNNAKGIYFLQVEQGEQVMMKKIVVQ